MSRCSCKECWEYRRERNRLRARAYRAIVSQDPEYRKRQSERERRRAAANPERVYAQNQRYRKAHPEKVAEWNKVFYECHPHYHRDWNREVMRRRLKNEERENR